MMNDDIKQPDKTDALTKILSALKNLKNITIKKKPDEPDFKGYANWNQTEEEYQREQEEWLKKFKKK